MEEGMEIRVHPSKVRPMPGQPRKYFNPDSIARLSVSMKNITQLVPGIIRAVDVQDETGVEYEILDGERRWRSATLADMEYRALLVKIDNAAVPFIIAAVANFNREGHTPTETSDTVAHMRGIGIPMEEIAKILGISVNWATQMHMLQRLVPDVRDMLDPTQVKSKILPTTAAIQIAKADPTLQLSLATMVMEKKVSLAEIRRKAISLSIEAGTHIRTRNEPRKMWRSIENQTAQAVRSLGEVERLLVLEESGSMIRARSSKDIAGILDQLKQLKTSSLNLEKTLQDARI